ncbi:hypothetical protein DH2020_003872 [Rehmannia glutinosa]|uniref:Uncharacterized protein n=1 Tax=Rehmannia glutinosa TaxID=99300 RepID=A0ABR0XMU9_REHGL
MYSPPLPRNHLSDSKRKQIVDSDGSPLRLNQVWKGRNKFICGGRFIFGPDVKSLFLTLSLILTPVILFWAFVAKGLIDAFSHGWGLLITVLSVIFTTYIIILLFLTSGIDPGIIPRNSCPPEPDDYDTSSLSTDWAGSYSSARKVGSSLLMPLLLPIVFAKRFGELTAYTPAFCSDPSRIMDEENCSIWKAVEMSPVTGILIMYTFVTTYENFRYQYDQKMNPYNLGYAGNLKEVFFSEIPRSRNNFRAKAKVDSAAGSSASSYLGQTISPEIPNRGFDVEMEKRQAVDADEFEDIRNQVGSFGGLERCGTQPRHNDWDQRGD